MYISLASVESTPVGSPDFLRASFGVHPRTSSALVQHRPREIKQSELVPWAQWLGRPTPTRATRTAPSLPPPQHIINPVMHLFNRLQLKFLQNAKI